MKNFLIALCSLISSYSFGCVCNSFEKSEVNELIEDADYALIGTPEEFLHWDLETRVRLNDATRGTGVKLRVDSILKGKINKDYLYINQFSNGNCTRWFELNNQYIILGYRIKKFIDVRPKEQQDQSTDEIPITLQPPPPPSALIKNKMECYDEPSSAIEYWNRLTKHGIIVHTNQCSAFNVNSVAGSWFVNHDG